MDKQIYKREEFLIPFSREHHHGLLLCWKIKTGFSKSVSVTRIKSYCDWFFKHHLLPHFELEEELIFPLLGSQNILIQQALEDHKRLSELFNNTSQIEDSLKQIQVDLEKHIRFEERILFREIQNVVSKEKLKSIKIVHSAEKFIENSNDRFWL